MTLVEPSLDLHNIFMVLLVFAQKNLKISAMKHIFRWIMVPLGGRGLCMRGHGFLLLYNSYTKFK